MVRSQTSFSCYRTGAFRAVLASLLGTAAVSGPGWAAQPLKTYEYRARIPKTANTCQDEAKSLGERFGRLTGLQVASADCVDVLSFPADSTTYPTYSLLVTYRAEHPVSLYRAVYAIGPVSDELTDTEGFFSTYSECLDRLEGATFDFHGKTLLQPIVAACWPGKVVDNRPSYVLRVDGFGAPAKTLQPLAIGFRGALSDDQNRQVEDLIAMAGGSIVARSDGRALLYADDSYDLVSDSLDALSSDKGTLGAGRVISS